MKAGTDKINLSELRQDRPGLLLIGGGRVGGELLNISLPYWDITLVEKNPVHLNNIKDQLAKLNIYELPIRLCEGDATSPLVLRDAGIDKADAIVVTTPEDRINAEVCRIAVQEFKKTNVVSILNENTAESLFAPFPVELVSRSGSIAAILENKIHGRTGHYVSFGTEAGKIVETTVMAGSPVIGRPLEDLNTQSWWIAAIFRGKALIPPHHDTTLEENDRVLLVGKPEVLLTSAEYIRIGRSEFPSRYGDRLLLPVFPESPTENYLDEALYLAKNTSIRGVDLLCWSEDSRDLCSLYTDRFHDAGLAVQRNAASQSPGDFVLEAQKKEGIGCLVLPHPSKKMSLRHFDQKDFLRLLEEVTCPILVSRGTYPYRNIFVPVKHRAESIAAAELAMDLARLLSARVTAVSIFPPSFSVGEEEIESQREALAKTLSLGNLYRMRIEELEQEGNPIRELSKISDQFDLMVISHRRERRWKPFRPDISHHLILRSPCSVLVVEMGKERR